MCSILHQPADPGGLGISHFGPVAEGFVGVILGFGVLLVGGAHDWDPRMTTTERPDRIARLHSGPGRRGARSTEVQHSLRFDPRHFGIDPGEPWPDDVPRGQDDSHWRYENDPRGRPAGRAAHRGLLDLDPARLPSAWPRPTWPTPRLRCRAPSGRLAFLGLGVGLILWARDLLPGNEVTASRGHHNVSAEQDRRAVTESLIRGVEPMARRPFLFKMLGAVGAVFGLAILFPFASLGPSSGTGSVSHPVAEGQPGDHRGRRAGAPR